VVGVDPATGRATAIRRVSVNGDDTRKLMTGEL